MQFLTVCIFLLATYGLASAQAVPLPRAKPLSSGMGDPPRLAPMTPILPLHDVEAWPSDCGGDRAVSASTDSQRARSMRGR